MVNIKSYINLKYRILLIILAFSGVVSTSGIAQNVSATAEMDSSYIFIGGQIDLRLRLSQPADMKVEFPLLTDTITKNIEIVKAGAIDTLNTDNNRLLLQQTYTITSFDSGLHYIPPIKFEEAGKKLEPPVETNSLSLNVVNPFEEVDPQKGITDIKNPLDTPFIFAELLKYWPWALGIILLSGIITLIAYKYFGRKIPIKIFRKEEPKLSPHELAIKQLDKLKEEKLWQRDMIKSYYSRLTDTLRQYIEKRFDIYAMESTTDEIMSAFKNKEDIDQKSLDNLNSILTTADLVKFARHEPLPDENDLSMINAYFFINQTKLVEPKSLEEEKEDLMNKNEEENK